MASSIEIEELLNRLAKVEDQLGIVLFILNKQNKGLLNVNAWNPQVILSCSVEDPVPFEETLMNQISVQEQDQDSNQITNPDPISNIIIQKQELNFECSDFIDPEEPEFSLTDAIDEDSDQEDRTTFVVQPNTLSTVATVTRDQDREPTSSCESEKEDSTTTAVHNTASRSRRRKVQRNKTQKHVKASFTCPVCSKTFSSSFTRRRHHFLAHIKGNKCSTCSAVFESFDQLRAHMLASHSSKHKFYCQQCGVAYGSRSSLGHHMRKKHNSLNETGLSMETTTAASHKCETCGKFVQSGSSLKRHINLVHKQTKKCVCPYCSKTYQTSTNLKFHISLAHYLDGQEQEATTTTKHNNNTVQEEGEI